MSRRLLIVLVMGAATSAAAQEPGGTPQRNCLVEIDSVLGQMNIQQARGGERVYAGGGVFGHCQGQATTMQSDSLAWFSDRGELRLIGSVHFRDSTGILDADRVTYFVRREYLVAVGNVYTRNIRTKSDLRGPSLDYYRAVPPVRDTLEIVATGRPTIHFYPESDSSSADAGPFVIVADRVRMLGSDRMWAKGSVTIDRDDLAARGDSAELDLSANRGSLTGDPEVQGRGTDRYRLRGRQIDFELDASRQVRGVLSRGSAHAEGEDWTLSGDTLDLDVDSGAVRRAQAWGGTGRAEAVSADSRVVADSLDIHLPRRVVELVWAWGRARATTRQDTAQRADDWLVGDTLRADFVRVDSAARVSSELRHLTAFGSAGAYYHVENSRDPAGERGVSYSRGRRIDIAMREKRVHTVDVVGLVDGIYLEPLPPRPPGSDSTRADTTAAARRIGTAATQVRRIP